MEFLPWKEPYERDPLSENRWGYFELLLRKLDQIDEKKIVDPEHAQEVFLLKHRKELAEKVEANLIPKILEDIEYILKEGCAEEISKADFNHVHLCTVSRFPVFDVDSLLSSDNARLLYHTWEEWVRSPIRSLAMPSFAKRNIKSSLTNLPEIVPIEYSESETIRGHKTYEFHKVTVYSSDLGWSAYGKIEFEEKADGAYGLKSGKKLDMKGILWNLLPLIIKVNGNMIEFEGKEIGRIKLFE